MLIIVEVVNIDTEKLYNAFLKEFLRRIKNKIISLYRTKIENKPCHSE